MRKGKPSRAVRKELASRWDDEIFPALYLVYGAPPSLKGTVSAARWAALDARTRYHRAVSTFYHYAYLRHYDIDNGITSTHVHGFASLFMAWAGRQRYENKY